MPPLIASRAGTRSRTGERMRRNKRTTTTISGALAALLLLVLFAAAPAFAQQPDPAPGPPQPDPAPGGSQPAPAPSNPAPSNPAPSNPAPAPSNRARPAIRRRAEPAPVQPAPTAPPSTESSPPPSFFGQQRGHRPSPPSGTPPSRRRSSGPTPGGGRTPPSRRRREEAPRGSRPPPPSRRRSPRACPGPGRQHGALLRNQRPPAPRPARRTQPTRHELVERRQAAPRWRIGPARRRRLERPAARPGRPDATASGGAVTLRGALLLLVLVGAMVLAAPAASQRNAGADPSCTPGPPFDCSDGVTRTCSSLVRASGRPEQEPVRLPRVRAPSQRRASLLWICGVTEPATSTRLGTQQTVWIDKTAPTAAPARRRAVHLTELAGIAAPVQVAFSGADAMSGVPSCTAPTYSGPDGASAQSAGPAQISPATRARPPRSRLKYDSTGPVVRTGKPASQAGPSGLVHPAGEVAVHRLGWVVGARGVS